MTDEEIRKHREHVAELNKQLEKEGVSYIYAPYVVETNTKVVGNFDSKSGSKKISGKYYVITMAHTQYTSMMMSNM